MADAQSKKILAFGATGPIAGLVLSELARRQSFVRAFIRREEQRAAVRERGASEIAIGDLRDGRSIADGLHGMDAVFYIAPVHLLDQAELGVRLIAQAANAGVQRFVFSSVIHPVLGLSNHAAKVPVEEALVDSGMEFVILHPGIFYQNFATAWRGIIERRQLAEPWSSETRHSRVDYRDVAEVAAVALLENRLTNGTFELCAEGPLNRREIAAMLSDITGHEVEARTGDPSAFGSKAEGLRPMIEHYNRHGLVGNALILRTVREPRSLRSYFEELARVNS
jgi:uncharacterized protein YbjT (DUF2867 family)